MKLVDSVRVDEQGFILVGDEKLDPFAAATLAEGLLYACQDSRDREQRKHPSYYDASNCLARLETPLGQAIQAVKEYRLR